MTCAATIDGHLINRIARAPTKLLRTASTNAPATKLASTHPAGMQENARLLSVGSLVGTLVAVCWHALCIARRAETATYIHTTQTPQQQQQQLERMTGRPSKHTDRQTFPTTNNKRFEERCHRATAAAYRPMRTLPGGHDQSTTRRAEKKAIFLFYTMRPEHSAAHQSHHISPRFQ